MMISSPVALSSASGGEYSFKPGAPLSISHDDFPRPARAGLRAACVFPGDPASIGGRIPEATGGLQSVNMIAEIAGRLLPPHEARKVLGGNYTDALHTALLHQLEAVRGAAESSVRRPQPLPKWRLERVVRHIDSHIDEAISLPAMAAIAGVSRMHFAAQFRAATGLKPHDYLLRRRIAVAKRLLADPGRPIVDIAFSVGFQSQSHFTTVFKRHLGMPPNRWRRQQHEISAEGLN